MTKRNDETRCDSSERVEAWQLSRSVSLGAKRKGARRREMPPARRDRAKRSEAKNGAEEELSAELPKACRKLHVCACSGPQPAGGFSAEAILAGLAARRRLMSASGGSRTPESAGSKAEDGCPEQTQVLYSKATTEQQRKNAITVRMKYMRGVSPQSHLYHSYLKQSIGLSLEAL